MPLGSELSFARPDDTTLVVMLAGAWSLRRELPSADGVAHALESDPAPTRLAFDTERLAEWDSGLLTFLTQVFELCRDRGVTAMREGLPDGIRRLLSLAEAVPETEDAKVEEAEQPFLDRVGEMTLTAGGSVGQVLEFLGEAVVAVAKFTVGRARFRRADFALLVQQTGVEALGIVTLVSFLLGLILAFVGAIQLEQFGATIYIADLVGIAMVRDMGALITGIVMAGRSGAAFAAQLGSMKVTQEIDALCTTGVSPMEFLVLPRMLALIIMMPLLTIYADVVGVVGGLAVGTTTLDISFVTYIQQTTAAVGIGDLVGGVVKGATYGVLIALAGCLRGMQARKSSAGVGDAATSAVVTGIVSIIAASGIFQVLFYEMGW